MTSPPVQATATLSGCRRAAMRTSSFAGARTWDASAVRSAARTAARIRAGSSRGSSSTGRPGSRSAAASRVLSWPSSSRTEAGSNRSAR
ncbi:hypothetical protein [Microbispora sp. GKU 823]|uniref:hypothetical protein n=1 Tax=Microbispora sp. GKU 823 TaxID=1652100 RepID=UPI001C4E07DC|nr:hypothetical protein [Microbispora sp. GKU 823]